MTLLGDSIVRQFPYGVGGNIVTFPKRNSLMVSWDRECLEETCKKLFCKLNRNLR